MSAAFSRSASQDDHLESNIDAMARTESSESVDSRGKNGVCRHTGEREEAQTNLDKKAMVAFHQRGPVGFTLDRLPGFALAQVKCYA